MAECLQMWHKTYLIGGWRAINNYMDDKKHQRSVRGQQNHDFLSEISPKKGFEVDTGGCRWTSICVHLVFFLSPFSCHTFAFANGTKGRRPKGLKSKVKTEGCE